MAGWTQPACRRLGDMSNALLCRVPSPAPMIGASLRRRAAGGAMLQESQRFAASGKASAWLPALASEGREDALLWRAHAPRRPPLHLMFHTEPHRTHSKKAVWPSSAPRTWRVQ